MKIMKLHIQLTCETKKLHRFIFAIALSEPYPLRLVVLEITVGSMLPVSLQVPREDPVFCTSHISLFFNVISATK